MLQLRPSCEHCDIALPPDSRSAMICSYECTFCRDCVELLDNVCPNCGGGFVERPVRPSQNLIGGNYLGKHPATEKVTHKPVSLDQHSEFASGIRNIAPHKR